MIDDEDYEIHITEKGFEAGLEIHHKFMSGVSVEEIATEFDWPVDQLQIMMAIFYDYVEKIGIEL